MVFVLCLAYIIYHDVFRVYPCCSKYQSFLPFKVSFPDSLVGKEFACDVGDLGAIPGLGRCPWEGKSYPLQYSGLENSMDYCNESDRLSDFHFHSICGLGEDSWESLELQGDQTSHSLRKSALNIHWKGWSWSSYTLATWCEELTHWKRPWCWERL